MATIERAIIVAGASCVGKTTLLEALKKGQQTWLNEKLALTRESCEIYEAREWRQQQLPTVTKPDVLMHYDLFQILRREPDGYKSDPALGLLRLAKSVSVITMWEPPSVLLARTRGRRNEVFLNFLQDRDFARLKMRIQWRKRVRALYASQALWEIYMKWFEFCRRHDIDAHWTVRPSVSNSCMGLEQALPVEPFWNALEFTSENIHQRAVPGI